MEVNIVRKKVRRGLSRIALVYPSTYEAMATSLSVHIVYYMVNGLFSEVYLERFYAHSLHGVEPEARSLETRSPLRNYELILTSIHYEPAIASLVRMLYYSGINPIRSKREIPIVAGGPAVMANPHPYADIVDAFIIGEAEATLSRVVDAWLSYRGEKKKFLEEIASLKYVYVPGINEPQEKIYRVWVENLDTAFYPIRQFYNPEREPVFGRGFLLETSRGCMFWCRFCLEGKLFKPYRKRSYSALQKLVNKGLRVNNTDRVVVYSLVYPSSPDEKLLLEYLVDNGIKASLPSMRANYLDRGFLELARAAGQETLTIAPESFSPFIQRIIGKYFELDPITELILEAAKLGFNIKIYVIYGVKGEKRRYRENH